MKKNVIKTAIAAVCVVVASMGGMKAYNAANQSEADMLLSENVEALSAGDFTDGNPCKSHPTEWCPTYFPTPGKMYGFPW